MNRPKIYSYIRFSTKEQLKGDSLRRQKEAIEKYRLEKGFELDTSLNLQDLGIPAYKGKHRKVGALGEFLTLVNDDKIAKGSVLLIENIDRLSREPTMEALKPFEEIIRAGIMIVTLMDKQEYTEESINENPWRLQIILSGISLAHQESKNKSERVGEAWRQKRNNIRKSRDILTSRCPAWLEVMEDKKGFKPIKKRISTIEQIFLMKLSGMGSDKIARTLNLRSPEEIWIPEKREIKSRRGTFTAGGWRQSYINKILHNNRQLIGEFQPYNMVDGKRVPEGSPIKNYYPKAISEELFYQVQSRIEENRRLGKSSGYGGGKTGKVSNLFTHIVKCGFCGSSMVYINKGYTSKGGQYLHCDASRRKLDSGQFCSAKPIHYNEFESLFFKEVENLNLDKILPVEDEIKNQISNLEGQLDSTLQQLKLAKKSVSNLISSIMQTNDEHVRELFVKEIEKTQWDETKLLENSEKIKQQIEKATEQRKKFIKDIDQAKEFHQLMASAKDPDERIKIRQKLRLEIRKIVELIKIYPPEEKENTIRRTKAHLKEFKRSLKGKKDISFGENIRLDAIENTLKYLSGPEYEDLHEIRDSKYIDKVRIKYTAQSDILSSSIFLKHLVDESDLD